MSVGDWSEKMSDLTLESLAARVAELERKLAEKPKEGERPRYWRTVVGISEDNEFTRAMLAEIEANSESERLAAQADAP
jgi:hypothetical protein